MRRRSKVGGGGGEGGGSGDGVSAVGSMAGRQMGTTDYALVLYHRVFRIKVNFIRHFHRREITFLSLTFFFWRKDIDHFRCNLRFGIKLS